MTLYSRLGFHERFIRTFIITIGFLCQQGFYKINILNYKIVIVKLTQKKILATNFNFDATSGRLAVISILLFGLLINNYYLASVVSTRVNSKIQGINDSLNELKKLDLQFGSQPLPYTEFYLRVIR